MTEWKPGREGPRTEWKQWLPRDERVARTLAAFANGGGGALVVGVSDSGEVVGVEDPWAVIESVRRIARERVDPPVSVSPRRIVVRDRSVVEFRILAPDRAPVVVLLPDGRRVPYVRDGSSSRPAGPRELKALAHAPARAVRLDDPARRFLAALACLREPSISVLARAARMGPRTARRVLVVLVEAGLVMENEGGRIWLTPLGHERVGGGRR